MKKNYIIGLAASLLMVGCAEERESDFMVDKPESAALYEQLSSYDVLKNYVPEGGMKVAAAMTHDQFTGKGTMYSLAMNNFTAISPVAYMNMAANMSTDGSVDAGQLQVLANEANDSGIDVFGPAIISHKNQLGSHIRSLYDDIYVPGDRVSYNDLVEDFESSPSVSLTSAGTIEVVDDPDGNNGKVIHVNKAKNSYAKINVKLPEGRVLGDYDQICYHVRINKGIFQQLYFGINDKAPVSYGLTAEKMGCEVNKWNKDGVIFNISKMNLTEDEKQLNEFTLATGLKVASTSCEYWLDNIKFVADHELPGTTIVKTPEERAAIVTDFLNIWTAGVMKAAAGYIKDFDLVEDPMSDDDSEMLRPLPEETVADNEYYYSEYLGEDYVNKVAAQVRENAVDTAGNKVAVKLFVSEYNLEQGNKCDRLVSQLKKWSGIDGVSVKLSLNCAEDAAENAATIENLKQMFGKLATSGKLIRIASLDVNNNDNTAEFLSDIVKAFIAKVPAAQRHSVTLPVIEGSNAGLWDSGYNRTLTYKGAVEALSGK